MDRTFFDMIKLLMLDVFARITVIGIKNIIQITFKKLFK